MSEDNNSWVFFVMIIPIMMLVLIPSLNSNDPLEYDLLTDEQKLEKQAEIELVKQNKIQEKIEADKVWNDSMHHIVYDKPPLAVIIAFLIPLAIIITSGNDRRRGLMLFGDSRYLEFLNFQNIIGIFLLIMAIAWLGDFMDMGKIVGVSK